MPYRSNSQIRLASSMSSRSPNPPGFSANPSSPITYAQLVIGPPGSGKTTYCLAMKTFLSALGRKVAVVNLDPANSVLPYECEVDISELICLEEVMEKLCLGPNGSLVYCMEFLEKNLQWLHTQLQKFKGHYILLDCPGQVELYTHHNSVKNVSAQLLKWNFKLVAVNLVDSHYCHDPGTFVSVLLTSLATMVQMELPHINVLSKIDLLEQCGKLPFSLEFYTDVLDLSFLMEHLSDDPFFRRYKKLNEALIGLVEDYSLVSFVPLNVQDRQTMLEVVRQVDKANGYVYGQGPGGEEASMATMMSTAVGAEFDFFKTASVKEKYQTNDNN